MHFFDEIKDYIGFTEDDARRLQELRPEVEPYFGPIVANFYEALLQNPRARGVFVGPEQIERLRVSLMQWLGELFEGPYDAAYSSRRMLIGEVHVNVGLLPQFMFGAMNLIRIDLIKAVSELRPEAERQAYITSVQRIVDIDLTLMVQSYWDTLMRLKLQIPAALATGLAHEIRNPLNAIGLQMTLLERRLRNQDVDHEVFQPVLDAVRTELRRIQGLNSEILDFAKPIEITRRPVNVSQIFAELHHSHGLTLEAGNVVMECTLEGLPVIWCDPDRLNQVFVNLLTNAMEALPDEGGRIDIRVQNNERGTVINFVDNGQGMTPTMKYRIFDLFFTTKASGTGIGLAIARKIVDAHGGSIDLTSRPGLGTHFTIHLPSGNPS
ncbi:MAG: GHKL domain-containing protein [Bradymonadaceae bacterium]|nr:GHKL domain-containing protein [Lujinxingiaceae bacterium]